MTTDALIAEVMANLDGTDDLSQLTDWDMALSVNFADMASKLAEVKRRRAEAELGLKSAILASDGKYTEKAVERAYFTTEDGKYYLYATEMLKAVGKLISAVRFKARMIAEPLR